MSEETWRRFDVEAELREQVADDLGDPLVDAGVLADHQDLLVALVLAALEAGLAEVLRRQLAGRRSGSARKSRPNPSSPPASSNPGIVGGMKWVAIWPTSSPPRARRSASRSAAAITALRTLMSSNGGICVFSAT